MLSRKRVFNISSVEDSNTTELSKTISDLTNNGGAYSLTCKCEMNIMGPNVEAGHLADIVTKICGPIYVMGITERVSESLKPENINLFSRSWNSIRDKVFRIKDERSFEEKKNLVYEIGCNQCQTKCIE